MLAGVRVPLRALCDDNLRCSDRSGQLGGDRERSGDDAQSVCGVVGGEAVAVAGVIDLTTGEGGDPETVVAEQPASVPPLGLLAMNKVIALPSAVTTLPPASSIATTGCCVHAVPPVPPPGWVVNASAGSGRRR